MEVLKLNGNIRLYFKGELLCRRMKRCETYRTMYLQHVGYSKFSAYRIYENQ